VGRVSCGGLHPMPFLLGRKSRLTHEPGHPFASDASPLILQLPLDARTPVSASVRDKDLSDLLRKLSIFSLTLAGRTLAPGIQATFRDSEHVAHDDDGKFVLVLFNKLIPHLESREKMLTTFFSMSRSCWTRSRSRLSRRFSSSSAV
jgi:hypothetical protein